MEDKVVTVARFSDSVDAHLAQMRLDSNGIESVIVGEESASTFSLPQLAFIELRVAGEQADEAVKILETEQ